MHFLAVSCPGWPVELTIYWRVTRFLPLLHAHTSHPIASPVSLSLLQAPATQIPARTMASARSSPVEETSSPNMSASALWGMKANSARTVSMGCAWEGGQCECKDSPPGSGHGTAVVSFPTYRMQILLEISDLKGRGEWGHLTLCSAAVSQLPKCPSGRLSCQDQKKGTP